MGTINDTLNILGNIPVKIIILMTRVIGDNNKSLNNFICDTIMSFPVSILR